MGGEGSILAMITSLKNNNAWRGKRKSRFTGLKVHHPSTKPLDLGPKMTPAQFAAFRRKLKHQRRVKDGIRIGIAVLSVAIGLLLIYLVAQFLNND